MVNMLRHINCRLTDVQPNLSDEEKVNFEKRVREEVIRVSNKASQLEEMDGCTTVITDIDVLGRLIPEVIVLHSLSEGKFYTEIYPIQEFYRL